MQAYAGLARRIAQKYLPYCSGAVDLDDLMQAAAIGAILAEATYSPEKGKWASWVAYYIHNEMRAAVGFRTAHRDPADTAFSLDKQLTEDGSALADTLEDAALSFSEASEQQAMQRAVREAVAELAPDRRCLVEMLYFDEESKVNTAKALGCSLYRLSVIKQEAFRDLRSHPKIKMLSEDRPGSWESK